MKQWIQTLSCYCRTASTVYYARFTVRCMLSSTVYWLALYAYWFFLFYYQSSLHNNIFTDQSVLPKIVLFEVQSGFWRLLPEVSWGVQQHLTGCQQQRPYISIWPWALHVTFYFINDKRNLPDETVLNPSVEQQTCFGPWSDLNRFIGSEQWLRLSFMCERSTVLPLQKGGPVCCVWLVRGLCGICPDGAGFIPASAKSPWSARAAWDVSGSQVILLMTDFGHMSASVPGLRSEATPDQTGALSAGK